MLLLAEALATQPVFDGGRQERGGRVWSHRFQPLRAHTLPIRAVPKYLDVSTHEVHRRVLAALRLILECD